MYSINIIIGKFNAQLPSMSHDCHMPHPIPYDSLAPHPPLT